MSEHGTDLRAALLAAIPKNAWWDVVTDPRYCNDDSAKEVAGLHNAGEIDFIRLYSEQTIKAADPEFFFAQHLFCKVLPLIHGCLSQIVDLVNSLTDIGAGDLAANNPKAAFRDWCSKNEERPRDALQLIKARPCSDLGVLSLVLEAGAKFDLRSYVVEALEFTRTSCETRLSAVTALGRIDTSVDQALQLDALHALRRAHDSTDDDIVVANIVGAVSRMYSRDASLIDHCVGYIISKASVNPGPATQLALAGVVRQHHAQLPGVLLDTILMALVNVSPEHDRIVSMIDVALSEIDLAANENRIISFLRSCLVRHEGALSIAVFKLLLVRFRNQSDFVGRLSCRWFLEADPILCESIASIFKSNRERWNDLKIDFVASGLTGEECVFVCRKAIGYMSAMPTVVSQFLVGALRGVPSARDAISGLLFDPVLINSRGEARAYVDRIASDESDPASGCITEALARLEKYLEGLRSVGAVKEMEPSERQRRTSNDVRSQVFSAAFEESKKGSLVSLIATESVVLYGDGAVSYFDSGDNTGPRRTEIPFQSHMTSVEWPALEVVDPVGTSYLLAQMRSERRSR